ncbi:hypothetical protein CYMTET_31121 [Cymbomonas tetramitiformis]|uniref:Uncharacterized protein n=1 Tax=Cymbomonas tetramitiformis TaxID=36881 RepID=A0AAE0FHR0_9CHLO|nr:hypothetical protein CYMTET_31121 [Cymbomonas tetramitiformis]
MSQAGPPLQNAALRYEQAIRIFRPACSVDPSVHPDTSTPRCALSFLLAAMCHSARLMGMVPFVAAHGSWAWQASEVCIGGPAGASMNLQLLRAEAKAWRSVAYVRTMIGDGMIPAGIDAYLKASAMYKSLGMVREVGICVADMGRVRLAEGNIPQAASLLSNASRLLKMDVVGGDKLEAGAALQYVGELKVQIHLQNPDGWEKCKSGHDEDVDLVQTAIEDLEAAQEIFVAKSDAIPSKVLSGIRWSMGQAQLLVGSIDKAKELIRQALVDESWKAENQHETQQAEALLGRLTGNDKKK